MYVDFENVHVAVDIDNILYSFWNVKFVRTPVILTGYFYTSGRTRDWSADELTLHRFKMLNWRIKIPIFSNCQNNKKIIIVELNISLMTYFNVPYSLLPC